MTTKTKKKVTENNLKQSIHLLKKSLISLGEELLVSFT